MNKQLDTHTAVIIGGSIAGLLTARVIADHFAHVIILERDRLPALITNRKGAPQGRHAHALLGQGHQIMEQLFPGLTQELIEDGAVEGNGRFFSGGGYFARHPNAPARLYVSRPRLEAVVRRRTLQMANVTLRQTCDVLGFTTSADRQRVTGVRLIDRQGDASAEVLSSAFVVDASGRGSRTPAWLEALGYAKPDVDVVEVNMGYASRLYERKPEHLGGDLMINLAPTPDQPIACGMLAQENNSWMVTLAGYFGNYPPTDETGFLAFARQLPTTDVYDVISTAKPLSDPVAFRFPSNLRRRYEKLTRFPTGLLVLGDALCSFTPIYGQGMSTAAMEAAALQATLAQGEHDLARRFFGQAARIIDIPWGLTVGNDRRLSRAKLPLANRCINWYISKLQRAARLDPELALAFQNVGNLFTAPHSLLHPRLAWRVLRGNLVTKKPNASQLSRQTASA